MKQISLLNWLCISLCALLMMTACSDTGTQIKSEPPPLYSAPKTVSVNTTVGYTQNTVTGIDIQPVINSKGDTVLTGVPIPITGHVTPSDSISEPIKRRAAEPHVEYNELNVRVISKDIPVIEINPDSLIRLSAEDEIECEVCVSEIGDTIPTGVALPVIGRVVPCIQPQPVIAGAPEYKHSASLNIQLLGIDQGLEGSYVRAIVEDSRGNIWLGSYYGGVSRYDGTTFVTYGEEEGLSNGVYAIVEDRNGNMWFATNDKGVCMYDGKTFTFYSEKEGLSSNYFYSMFEDSKGNIWVGSADGVSKLSFGDGAKDKTDPTGQVTVTNYTEKEGFIDKQVRGIVEDDEGNLWFGSRGGGVCMMDAAAVSNEQDPIVFTHYQIKDGLAGRYINSMHVDMQGNIWFNTGSGLTKLSKTGKGGNVTEYFTNYYEKDGLGGEVVFEMIEEENGDLWFGSYGGGLTKLSKTNVNGVEVEIFTVYREEDGLSTNEGGPHLVDKAGNIWSMAWGEGVSIIRSRPFRNYTLKNGLPYDRVYAVVEDNTGGIWVGTDGGGARKLVLGGDQDAEVASYVSYPTDDDLSNGGYYDMFIDRTGNIWFGDYGVSVLTPSYANDQKAMGRTEYVTKYSTWEGLVWSRVRSMMEDHFGNVWIGTSEGLSKFIFEGPEKGSVVHYSDDDGSMNYYPNSLLEDAEGNIWMGTGAGLSKLSYDQVGEASNETLTHYTEKEGLCNNAIEALLEDRNGNIWIGTDNGLDVLHKPTEASPISETVSSDQFQITHYTQKEGLSHNAIHSIIEDNNGHIWVGTKSGLNELVLGDGPDIVQEIRHYGKFDGLKGVDFISNSALLDSKNRLWWGCTKSLNMLDLDRFTTTQDPPSVHLNDIYINEQFIDHHNLVQTDSTGFSSSGAVPFYNYPQDLILDHNKDHLTFHFAAIDRNAPHKIKFSHKLVGLNDKWSKVSAESKAEYRNIPHGTYTFKVRAIGESGEWSDPFEYEFTVDPPWWHTWWARALYVIALSLVIWSFVRRRTAELKKRQLELESEVEVATQEIVKQKEVAEEEREKAVRSEAFKQQFLANMSHEIRTPMNAVMGMTSLLLDKQPREDQFKYLDGIRTSGDNLLHIINDILDLSKIESGKMELEHIDFSLKATIDHVKKILDHKAAEKGLELLTSIGSDVTDIVVGDPIRLNQVLINLTGNAIKFTETGSVAIEVSKAKNGIEFSIVDTGIGIPEDKLQTVFENFTQANASDTRKHGGTGLGLSISRQLVDIMGGRITVESKEGYGTTFSFTVDLEEGSAERLEERLALDKDVDGSILNGLKILITDDNEYNRIVAKDTLLSKADVEIHEAEDGQQAIDMVGKMTFDVILMDIQMPGMNGFDATRYIRANFESPVKDTPIIALTASVLRTDLDKCKQAGMDSYIPKPFKAQQLITGIAQVLGIKLKVSKTAPKETSANGQEEIIVNAITDMTYLRGFCEGDAEKMKKYIGMFTSTAPALIEKIRTALEKNDLVDIADQVHAFKTKWIMMGMTSTKDLALELERQCRGSEDIKDINENAELLIEHITRSLVELKEA